ncbi:HU family DNA-binding protein [Phocaeicola sp.]
MSDIKFDIYESPGDGEKKKYHVRTTNRQTIASNDLIRKAVQHSGVSRPAWMGVVEELIDSLSEHLSEGKRIHIDGLGYFSINIGSSESENPKAMTRRTIRITGINFQPEKSFLKGIRNKATFVRERYKSHTADLSPIEIDGLLTEYFKDHRSITCTQFQQTCGMTRTTAYRRLAVLVQGEHPSLQREGYKNSTVYIPTKGHYGRSYADERW